MSTADQATKLVGVLLEDFTGRSGFDSLWDGLDSETQADVRHTWRIHIQNELQRGADAIKLLERIDKADCLRNEDEELHDDVARFLKSES